jgi:hypothetical protein
MSENFEPGNFDAKPLLFTVNSRLGRVVANEIPPRACIAGIYLGIGFVFQDSIILHDDYD